MEENKMKMYVEESEEDFLDLDDIENIIHQG